MNSRIIKLFGFIIVLFAVLIGFTSWWSVFDAKALKEEEANQRPLLEQQQIPRGRILADDGSVIAKSYSKGHGSASSSSHAAAPTAPPTAKAQPAPKSTPQPAPKSAPKPAPPVAKPAPPANNGIPQNNGGDGDSDNNGGPSDGDGEI